MKSGSIIYHFYSRKSEHGNYHLWHYKPIYDKILYIRYHQHMLNVKYGDISLSTYRYNKKINRVDKPNLPKLLDFFRISSPLMIWRANANYNHKWATQRRSRKMKWHEISKGEIINFLGVRSYRINGNILSITWNIPTINNYKSGFLKGNHKIGLEKIKNISNKIKGTIYVKVLIPYEDLYYEYILRRFFDEVNTSRNKIIMTWTGNIYTWGDLGLKIPM